MFVAFSKPGHWRPQSSLLHEGIPLNIKGTNQFRVLKQTRWGVNEMIHIFIIVVVDIDNVSNDKSPFSNEEGGFRGMGLVF